MRRLLPLFIALAAVGCKHTAGPKKPCPVDRCAVIPPGAIPQPIGTFAREPTKRQAQKAEADDFVIYYNEWLDDQAALGPFGADHVAGIVARLPYCPFPVVVQPEPDRPDLTADRMRAVTDMLLAAGVADAPTRVVSARPAAEGLYGEEGERIYPQLVRGGLGRGLGGNGGIGGIGSFGGLGGFGGFGGLGGYGGFGGFGGLGY